MLFVDLRAFEGRLGVNSPIHKDCPYVTVRRGDNPLKTFSRLPFMKLYCMGKGLSNVVIGLTPIFRDQVHMIPEHETKNSHIAFGDRVQACVRARDQDVRMQSSNVHSQAHGVL